MNKIAKVLLVSLMIAAMPIKHWAQTPYRQYAEDGILLNFHEIDNVDFRVYLLYNLSQNHQFSMLADDEPGLFSITSSEAQRTIGFFETFETFYQNAFADFSLLSKMDIYELSTTWKSCVPPPFFASVMMDIAIRNTRVDNNHCVDSDPFCTSDEIVFQASATSQTADQLETGTFDDGCIGSSYNPSWYHMRINNPGQFIIHMEGVDPNNSSIQRDIDFCMWGPFTDPTAPCVSQLTTNKIIDCCYSAYYSEDAYLGYQAGDHYHQTSHGTVNYHVPQTGEYYILMITNFSQQPCVISFTKADNSGPGTTDCGILPGVVTNDGPYCVGETITLHVNQQAGATYTWSGPNGYTSTTQNPTRPNCTLNMAGTYTCVTSVGGESSSASTEVVIYPQPTANFTAPSVCEGEATHFTSTSTTNPSGQTISNYQWNFGDGQSATGATANHTYAHVGTYQATLTVSTGNGHCTNAITKTVIVEALPTPNFEATTVCLGQPTVFTYTSESSIIRTYDWNFGDGQTGSGQTVEHIFEHPGAHQVSLTVTTSGGCVDDITKTVNVYPMPVPTISGSPYVQYNGTTTLTVNPGAEGNFTYHWEPTGMVQGNPDSQTIQTVPLLGNQEYTVTVTGVPGGCTVTIPITVVMDGSDMTASATADQYELCQGDYTTLHAHPSAGTGNYNYTWSPAETLSNAHSQNPVATPEVGTTTYTCVVSDGVVNRNVEVTITVHPNKLTPFDDYFCANETYSFFNRTLDAPGTYTHRLETSHGCDSIIELHLTKKPIYNETQTEEGLEFTGIFGCDSAYWNPQGHSYDPLSTYNPANHWFKVSALDGSPFKRMYESQFGCDSLVNLPLTLEYTPNPFEIVPVSEDNNAPHWVVTATEFQINTYDFYVYENEHDACHWDSVRWQFEDPEVSWVLERDTTTVPIGLNCRMYVLNYIEDTVWLQAKVYNKCAPEGVTRRYWFVSSFYDVDESLQNAANFHVIPNPNNGQMTLRFEGLSGKIGVKVFDMRGTLIDEFETFGDSASHIYQMKDRANGIYFFVATSKEGTLSKKVIIQH